MTYPRYYVCLLNFVHGRNLHDDAPPDSIADTELKLMEESAAKAGLWTNPEKARLNHSLRIALLGWIEKLTNSHAFHDKLRVHSIAFHPKETLWLEALDKALPLFNLAVTQEWAKNGMWMLENFNPTRPKDHCEDEAIIHLLLISLIQFSFRELDDTCNI